MRLKLPAELFEKYSKDPSKYDPLVRAMARVPDDRYYTVAVWPESMKGTVEIRHNSVRLVRSEKISKSP